MDPPGLYARLLSYIFIKNLRQWIKKHFGLIFRCNQISFLSYSLQNLFIVKDSGNHLPSIFSNNEFCVYRHLCVWACVCLCMCVAAASSGHCFSLPFSTLFSHWAGNSLFWLGWLVSKPAGSAWFCFSKDGVEDVHCHTLLLCGCWGSKLRSTRWCSRHFPIEPSPQSL